MPITANLSSILITSFNAKLSFYKIILSHHKPCPMFFEGSYFFLETFVAGHLVNIHVKFGYNLLSGLVGVDI